ncbi:hypothetical protein C8K36_10637 [Rhodococcus sp. OK519]|uniref:hypothetical protein n=1 Tax=Rhodococcus sp. OK519 TaxID=2135729 RepID=UPI000D3C47E1|nr:hypothetical protein C8K36_10637 [Rhodococcus sp. OK519]
MPERPERRPARTVQTIGVAVAALVVLATTLTLTGSLVMATAFGVACAIGVAAILVLWRILPPTDD